MMTEQEMRNRLEDEFQTGSLPEKARDQIWTSAWDHGHAYGFYSVRDFYMDFVDVVKAVRGDVQ